VGWRSRDEDEDKDEDETLFFVFSKAEPEVGKGILDS
jgi:hypothetical protein